MRGLYFWQMFYTQTYKSNWWSFIGKRLLVTVIAFFVISMAIFFPAQAVFASDPEYYGYHAKYGGVIIEFTVEQVNEFSDFLKVTYHLNDPLFIQYFRFIGGILTGNFPPSLTEL
jgi:peptide/nickel transport system permease protein